MFEIFGLSRYININNNLLVVELVIESWETVEKPQKALRRKDLSFVADVDNSCGNLVKSCL